MPHYATAYALKHTVIAPKDYFGYMKYGEIEVYDPKQFEDWYERADTEIYRYMLEKRRNVVVIRGYGIYAFARTAQQLAKEIAVLENSCKILHIVNSY